MRNIYFSCLLVIKLRENYLHPHLKCLLKNVLNKSLVCILQYIITGMQ